MPYQTGSFAVGNRLLPVEERTTQASALRANAITTFGFASMSEALLRAIHQGFSLVAVPCVIEDERFAALERATGAAILDHHVVLRGLCRDCRKAGKIDEEPA